MTKKTEMDPRLRGDMKCGFIAIIGEPNTGKSTLINALVGQKISITTPKAQTTRVNVRGVVTQAHTQMIFIDTPGIFSAKHSFDKNMVKAAWGGVSDADAVLVLVDAPKGITLALAEIITTLPTTKPCFVAINKTDRVKKERLLELASTLAKYKLRDIFFISALKKNGLTDLTRTLAKAMPEGPFHFPDDAVSDVQMRELAAEITREKLFLLMGQELPYSAHVETEYYTEKKGMIAIKQVITIERESHKKMVIGEKGAMIKRIGSAARRELEKMLEQHIHLELFVKVRAGWKEQ